MKPPPMNGLSPKNKLQYYLIKLTLQLLAAIPASVLQFVAPPLGKLWYRLDATHRRIATDNMNRAFEGEFNPAEIHNRVKANFIQLTRMGLEIPGLLKLNAGNVDDFVSIQGIHHLFQARKRGKGVIILTAHLGHWEMMALVSALKFQIPLHVLVRPLDFKPMDRLLTEIRSRTGNRIIAKVDSAAPIGRLLRRNQVVGILLDQNASWYDGVYVPFFGRTACTNKGLAMLALRYGASVIPAFNTRRQDGRYHIIVEPAVSLSKTGNLSRDVIVNTARFNQIIEKHIRMAPDNWFWVHRRWRIKSIPPRILKKLNASGQYPLPETDCPG